MIKPIKAPTPPEIKITCVSSSSSSVKVVEPLIGNESNGVSEEIQQLADVRIKIPMVGNTESLNAGVAASLMAYEVLRKK